MTMETVLPVAKWQSQLQRESVKKGDSPGCADASGFLKFVNSCEAWSWGSWMSRVALRIVGDEQSASANQKGDGVSKLALIRNGIGAYKWIRATIQG
jgi:hypothetical protein